MQTKNSKVETARSAYYAARNAMIGFRDGYYAAEMRPSREMTRKMQRLTYEYDIAKNRYAAAQTAR